MTAIVLVSCISFILLLSSAFEDNSYERRNDQQDFAATYHPESGMDYYPHNDSYHHYSNNFADVGFYDQPGSHYHHHNYRQRHFHHEHQLMHHCHHPPNYRRLGHDLQPSRQNEGFILKVIGIVVVVILMMGYIPGAYLFLAVLIALIMVFSQGDADRPAAIESNTWPLQDQDPYRSDISHPGDNYDNHMSHRRPHQQTEIPPPEPMAYADTPSSTIQLETPSSFAEEFFFTEFAVNESAEEAVLKRSAEEYEDSMMMKARGDSSNSRVSSRVPVDGGSSVPKETETRLKSSTPEEVLKPKSTESQERKSRSRNNSKENTVFGNESPTTSSEKIPDKKPVSPAYSEKPVDIVFVDPILRSIQESVKKSADDYTSQSLNTVQETGRTRDKGKTVKKSKNTNESIRPGKKSSCCKSEADTNKSRITHQNATDWTITIPGDLLEKFLNHRCFKKNAKGERVEIEITGHLLGFKIDNDRQAYVTDVYLPSQLGSADTTETLYEMNIHDYVSKNGNLQILGWIHTHPTYDCFLSSIDLHTHYGIQRQQDCAVALVYSCSEDKLEAFKLNEMGMKVLGECNEPPDVFHGHPDVGPLYDRVEYERDCNRQAVVKSETIITK